MKKYLHLIKDKKFEEAEKLHLTKEPWKGARMEDFMTGHAILEKYGLPADSMFRINDNYSDPNCDKVSVVYHRATSEDDPVKDVRMEIFVAKQHSSEKVICYSVFVKIDFSQFKFDIPPHYYELPGPK